MSNSSVGASDTCQCHLRESEAVAGRIDLTDEPEEASYVQRGLVETQVVEALRQLGHVDRAANVATQMLHYAEGMESGRIRDRIAQVAYVLRPHVKVPAVAGFLEQVDAEVALKGF